MHVTSFKSAMGRLPGIVLMAALLIILPNRFSMADPIDASQLITHAIQQFESVQSYTCQLDKRVAKAGTLHEDLAIFVKYKKPAQYYFRWDRGPRRGREAIYAAGKNDGKIVAHPGGMFRFVTLHLNPKGRLAMKENRHALNNSGLEKIIQVIAEDHQRSQQQGLDVVEYVGQGRLDDRSVWVLQGLFPEKQGYYARKIILYIDQTLQLPIKVSIYNGSDALLEEYVFRNLKINVGWTEKDFQPDHPDYNFF